MRHRPSSERMRDAMDDVLRGSEAFLRDREPRKGVPKKQKDMHVRELVRVKRAMRTCVDNCGFGDLLRNETERKGDAVNCSASKTDVPGTEDVQESLEKQFEAERERIRRGLPQMPTKMSVPVDPTQAQVVLDTQEGRTDPMEDDSNETRCASKQGEEEDDEDVVQETPIVKETPPQEQRDRGGERGTSQGERRKSLHKLFVDSAARKDEALASQQPLVVSESQVASQPDPPVEDGLLTRSTEEKGRTPTGTKMLSLRIQETGTSISEPKARLSEGADLASMGMDGTPVETVKATDPDSAVERIVACDSLYETNEETQPTFDNSNRSELCPAVPVAMMKHEKEVIAVVLGGSESDVYAAVVCKGDNEGGKDRVVFVWQLSAAASVGEPFLLGGDEFLYRGNPEVVNIGLLATLDNALLVATDSWEHRSIDNSGSFCGVGGFQVSAEGMSCVFRVSCAHGPACLAVGWNRTLLVGGDAGRLSKASEDASRWSHGMGDLIELTQAKFSKVHLPCITHLAFVPEQRDIAIGTCGTGSIAVWNYVQDVVLMTAHDREFLLACLHPVGSLMLQSSSPILGGQSFGMQCLEEGLHPAFFLALVAERNSRDKAKCRPVWIGNNRVVVGRPVCDEPTTAVGSCSADGLLAWSDGVVTTWDPDSGEVKSLFEEHAGQEISTIATHHETGIIATATKHGEVVVYSLPV